MSSLDTMYNQQASQQETKNLTLGLLIKACKLSDTVFDNDS